MSIARKDDRHNDDLAKEIVDSFNRAVGPPSTPQTGGGAGASDGDGANDDAGDGAQDGEPEVARPRFVVTGDKRFGQRGHRKAD